MPYPKTNEVAYSYASNFITGDTQEERLQLLPKIRHTIDNFVIIGQVHKNRGWVQGSINAVGHLNRLIYKYDKIAESGKFCGVEKGFRSEYCRTLDQSYIYHECSDRDLDDYLDRQSSLFVMESEAIRSGVFPLDHDYAHIARGLFDVDSSYVDNAIYGFLFTKSEIARVNFSAMAKLLDIYDCLVDFEEDALTGEVCPLILSYCLNNGMSYNVLLETRGTKEFLNAVADYSQGILEAHSVQFTKIQTDLSEIERLAFDRVFFLVQATIHWARQVKLSAK